MWEAIKNFFTNRSIRNSGEDPLSDTNFKWYEVGDENPFGMKFLDMRSFSQTMLSTTENPKIAETFAQQRQSSGTEFLDVEIQNSEKRNCDLEFPHNHRELEGIVFKASVMEEKWDIYVYKSQFLFVRSWTGELQIRATAKNEGDTIRICQIETIQAYEDIAPQMVHFLLGTHAFGQILPHSIPEDFPDDPGAIAAYSFGLFGAFACFATYGDSTEVKIITPSE